MRVTRLLLALMGTLALLLPMSACAAPASVPVDTNTVVLDVRTPDEYAAGHLEGAKLLDLNSGEFEAALPDLDPNASYAVYCRSGNRSAKAVALMTKAGFANVKDLGAMNDAAKSTGLAVVTG